MKIFKRIYHAVVAAYIPCVLIAPMMLNGILGGGGLLPDSYWLTLLTILTYSFPYYIFFIWQCALFCRLADKGEGDSHKCDKSGKTDKSDKRERGNSGMTCCTPIDIAGAIISIASIVVGVCSVKIALALSAVLCVLWIADAVVTKRKLIDFAVFKDKAVWLCAAVLTVAVLAAAGICANSAKSRNVPDITEADAGVSVSTEYRSDM